jgi:hypothetical protein
MRPLRRLDGGKAICDLVSRCPECELPIAACNALFLYRKAAGAIRTGRKELAVRWHECAEEYLEEYLRARP